MVIFQLNMNIFGIWSFQHNYKFAVVLNLYLTHTDICYTENVVMRECWDSDGKAKTTVHVNHTEQELQLQSINLADFIGPFLCWAA